MLVAGSGPYATALAMVMGAQQIAMETLDQEPEPNADGGYPRVLGNLQRVFLVCGTSQSAIDALRCHESVWRWVTKLTAEGDQHELAVVFVIPAAGGKQFAEAIAAGLGLSGFCTEVAGHEIVCMDDSLEKIVETAASVKLQDLPPLRARCESDVRHAALQALRSAGTDLELVDSAKQVMKAFQGKEYLLDLFCRPPSHRNGNQLRMWLNGIVTGSVTPYDKSAESPLDWLSDTKFL